MGSRGIDLLTPSSDGHASGRSKNADIATRARTKTLVRNKLGPIRATQPSKWSRNGRDFRADLTKHSKLLPPDIDSNAARFSPLLAFIPRRISFSPLFLWMIAMGVAFLRMQEPVR